MYSGNAGPRRRFPNPGEFLSRGPDLTLIEAAHRLSAGRLTSAELVDAHLARIAERDRAIGAFAVVAPDSRRAATRADAERAAGRARGPLHGLPVAVKDLIDTAGLATGYGSHRFDGHVPVRDAIVVARLRAAGALVLGKTVTDEFGLGGPALDAPHRPPLNPAAPGRVTGGSSSGSAAAVAAGLVRVALGTDSGGSVRVPAAWCGVVGLKPGRGRLPLDGVFPLAPSLDTVGILAASVAEAACTCDVLAGTALAGATAHGVAGLRLGYARDWFVEEPTADPAMVDAIDAAVATLAGLGAHVAEVSLPDAADFEDCGARLLYTEAAEIHRAAMTAEPWRYGRLARGTLRAALALDPAALPQVRAAAADLRAAVEGRVFASYDALLTATVLGPPPRAADFDGTEPVLAPSRTIAFNVTGHPALSVPAGLARGLPTALQIVGPEAAIYRVGAALERALAGEGGAV